ncbi:hypothetical protein FOMPIDRAFT_128037 [Fomitopsis schrenkii]|uniref:Uncharacterized protein n=1 Tax=Fomitopsis schrenkii TaxID=2126942 RepID=S8E7U0_FOMSC|nr:hypothetical protein FOMPIDRAFT_128037 [Fomitopsis schrenkii]
MKANSKHPNGHTIVRTSIPPGTILYHGRPVPEYPERDWVAFDPEHAAIFAWGVNGTVYTFAATRDLTLLYFDGCSANKVDGVVDTQDILFWGKLLHKHTEWWGEMERLEVGCVWARQHGIDGFIRMEFDFEIIYCDFSDGLELVTVLSPVHGELPLPHPSDPRNLTSPRTWDAGSQLSPMQNHMLGAHPEGTFHGFRKADYPPEGPDELLSSLPPIVPPPGWKGTFPLTSFEARRAGAWHNDFPGLSQVHADASTLISFFDPSLRSLVDARRNTTRNQYAAGNASQEDIARVRQDVSEMALRSPGANSGVDWVGLARTIQERFKDRLPYLQHLLHQPIMNASAQAAGVRKQLIVSLIPHMRKVEIGEAQWFADIAHDCAARFTKSLSVSRYTKQEESVHHAVEEVLHEVCRVYTGAWVDAFDVESQSTDVAAGLLEKWRGEFDALIEWLDWPAWIQCHPACEVDEYCYVPQGKPWGIPDDHEPRCRPIVDVSF